MSDLSRACHRTACRLRAGGAALSVIALSACASYVRVESRFVEVSRQSAAEVTVTPEYFAMRPSIKRVALRAPDACSQDTMAEATGVARPQKTVLATRCGVEMAELERALVKASYTVYSWQTIASMVDSDRTLTPVTAAQRLGAQVLFQVNSLERAAGTSSADAKWERHYYKTKLGAARGFQPVPIALPARDRAELNELIAENERSAMGSTRRAAALDVSAVAVDTGQAIWFYQNKWVDPLSTNRTYSVIATRKRSGWVAVDPSAGSRPRAAVRQRSGGQDDKRASESAVASTVDRPSSQDDAEYTAIVRSLVADFVENFTKGSTRQIP